MQVRQQEIERTNSHFDQIIENIQDPGKVEREQQALEENPLFSAGIRGLDRLKWDYLGAQQVAADLRAQGL
jgi:hypothetical protein